jgi:hypothetical protein
MSAVVLIAALLFSAACYHTRVLTTDIPASADYNGPIYVNTFFWGLLQQDVTPGVTNGATPCASNALQEVRSTTTFGYALLTVITLGIWSRTEIQYKCAKEPPPTPPVFPMPMPTSTDTTGTQD